MSKPTISDQLDASNIVQNLIDNYEAQHRNEIPEGVQIALNRIYHRLTKDDERLLQPKPRKPRKPKTENVGDNRPVTSTPTTDKYIVTRDPYAKATFTPGDSVNPIQRTGKNNRNG
jgi:hypothetical protein